jgi:hypothetical protein
MVLIIMGKNARLIWQKRGNFGSIKNGMVAILHLKVGKMANTYIYYI